jgi:hypothetical protein
MHTEYFSENDKQIDHLDGGGYYKIYVMEAVWMGFVLLRIASNDLFCKNFNELLGFNVKSTEFLFSNFQAIYKKRFIDRWFRSWLKRGVPRRRHILRVVVAVSEHYTTQGLSSFASFRFIFWGITSRITKNLSLRGVLLTYKPGDVATCALFLMEIDIITTNCFKKQIFDVGELSHIYSPTCVRFITLHLTTWFQTSYVSFLVLARDYTHSPFEALRERTPNVETVRVWLVALVRKVASLPYKEPCTGSELEPEEVIMCCLIRVIAHVTGRCWMSTEQSWSHFETELNFIT